MRKAKVNNLRPEYRREDLGNGVRGKHLKAYRSGTNLVLLNPDVAKAFPTDEAVNEALRSLVQVAKRTREILNSPNSILVISTIVLAEIKYLFSRKKIGISFNRVMDSLREDPRVRIFSFDLSCVEVMDTGLDLHDTMIVATAKIFRNNIDPKTFIITKDQAIIDSRIAKTIW